MSSISFFDRILQKFKGLQLPEFQPELENQNLESIKTKIPEVTYEEVKNLVSGHTVIIKIVKGRRSKSGDFRPPRKNEIPIITLNRDLNPYSFLVTFLHEWAHLLVHERFGNKIKPHGREWKTTYQEVLLPYTKLKGLPEDFKAALESHMKRPKASTLGDADFAKFLKKYDNASALHLEDIPVGSVFKLNNGLILKKGELRRTRFLCSEINSNKKYTVHGLAEVELY